MSEGFLYILRPVLDLIPEVREQTGKSSFRDKVLWTGVTLFIYLICCQIPLYGVYKTSESDPLYWMRVILASNRGTLMELGISPLITSNMIVEFLANAKLISFDRTVATDKRLLQSAEKLLSVIVSFATAFAYVYSGMYGRLDMIGPVKVVLLILQLTLASVMVLYLDELLQKGYGIGSGISLFIATNISENVLWKAFSPVTIKTDSGIEFEGAIIALVHFLFSKTNKLSALYAAFYRPHLTNLHNIIATVAIFLIVIYFQCFQVDIPLSSRNVRGADSTLPIKLFYLSNTPIIIQTAVISNINILSSILYKKFGKFYLVRLLGVWKMESSGERLVSGLAYYLSPPQSLSEAWVNPGHFVCYMFFITVSCAVFSRMWLEMSGRKTEDLMGQLHEGKMVITHHERNASAVAILNRYIPVATILGGICIGLLSIVSDLVGTIGSGTGLLLVANIVYGYMESFSKEKDDFSGIFNVLEY